MSTSTPAALPTWASEVIDLYESGACAQFILHGNVDDRVMLPVSGAAPRIVSLDVFLRERLLGKFDVVISYDLGNGIRVEKGGDRFAEWPPAANDVILAKAPREAIIVLTHYLRFCANIARLKPEKATRVAVIVKNAGLIVPPSNGGANYELSAIASQLRDWATDSTIAEQHCTTFLLTENLNDLHPLVVRNPQAACIAVPLPQQAELQPALDFLNVVYPLPLKAFLSFAEPAASLAGATLSSVETLLQTRQHHGKELTPQDLVTLKKDLVEKDAQGLIEFIKPDRTLDDLHGQVAIKAWLRQDIALWRAGDLAALPMGYLFCGPVGTGKTFMVECLAGEAGVPVVKMKNFRDKWVGSTESNLEKIFRLLDALGRCIVFVDEADQALGRRNADSGDSGVSGRVYGMMAERMSDSRNRGRILWALATSRPDLVEVDLKRPGRVDVKIPIFPTATPEEGYQLIRALAKRRGVVLDETLPESFRASIPDLLTPGAAEALSVKLYRALKTDATTAQEALAAALRDYQPPVPLTVIHDQIALAVAEATDLGFVPERFRA